MLHSLNRSMLSIEVLIKNLKTFRVDLFHIDIHATHTTKVNLGFWSKFHGKWTFEVGRSILFSF